MVGEVYRDACRASRVPGPEVGGMCALAEGDAVPHLPDPPRAVRHRRKVVRAERCSSIRGPEEVECFGPREACGSLLGRLESRVEVIHHRHSSMTQTGGL